MRVAVLAYHSQNVTGNDYATNDHIALEEDLAFLARTGWHIVSARTLVGALISGNTALLPERSLVLTCDDGTLLDWEDFDHPKFGKQKSFVHILRSAVHAGLNAPTRGAMTAFVIASAQAHAAIDATQHAGIRITHDRWWQSAAQDGTLDIGCHSWDHCAPGIPIEARAFTTESTFKEISTLEHADQQVRIAGEHIRERCGDASQARLFAYPYGETSEFLLNTYMPHHPHGIEAAFTDGAAVVTEQTNRWAIPRYVCGAHWKSRLGLINILRGL
jgi:peptidoglycan/xylan/chitin deacetylase (PgdA/CDA1 family)